MESLSGVAAPSRAAHLVHLAPADPSRLARLALPSLVGAAADATALRTLVLTVDADTAVSVAECIGRDPAQGSRFAAITSAARGARLLGVRVPPGVAMPATAAAALLGRAALALGEVSLVVVQMPLDADTASIEAIDAVLAELPKGARRLLLTPGESPAVEALIDRHFHKARRVREDVLDDAGSEFVVIVRALTTGRAARWVTLRRLLDELDPPSAVVLVGDDTEAAAATAALAALGYHDAAIVAVSRESTPASVGMVLFPSLPSAKALADAIAAQPTHLVVLCAPGELPSLRALAGNAPVKPWNLDGPLAQAESRDAVTRAKLRGLLVSGTLERELRTLAPLFDEYDASEIAAAALVLATEAERAATRVYIPAARAEGGTAAAPSARAASNEHPARSERTSGFGAPRDRGDRPPRFDGGERPRRNDGPGAPGGRFDRGDRPAGGAGRFDRGDRPTGGAGRFDRGDRPAGGAGRFDRGDRPAGGAGRFERDDRPAGGAGRFDRGDRPAGGAGRFERGDRPAGGAGRFDRGDRPAGGAGRFERGDRPAGGAGRFDRGDRPAGGGAGGPGGRFGKGGPRPTGGRPPRTDRGRY